MKQRLIIKRVSSVLPTFILIGLLLLAFVILWLTLVGVPKGTLRYLEGLAAEQGIYLRLGSVRLNPSAGLAVKVRDIRIYATAEDQQGQVPLLQSEYALATLKAAKLLSGSVSPGRAQLYNTDICLPLAYKPGEHLHIDDLMVDAVFTNGLEHMELAAHMKVMNIPVRLSYEMSSAEDAKDADASHRKPQNQPESASASEQNLPLDIPAYLAAIQPYLDEAHMRIAGQQWDENTRPSAEIALRSRGKAFEASLSAGVPCYETRNFHFRQAHIAAIYEDSVLTLNDLSFRTVDPDSEVRLKAAYSLEENRVSFNLKSSASLVPMIKQALKGHPPILEKFDHAPEDAPLISLSGDLTFSEEFSLEHAKIIGSMEQNRLRIGQQLIDRLNLSFLYSDGNFNLDRMELRYGGGQVALQANAQDGTGAISLEGEIPIAATLALASEFTKAPIIVPEAVSMSDVVRLRMKAKLDVAFREGDMLTLQTAVPHIREFTLSLGTENLIYEDQGTLYDPVLRLEITGLEYTENYIPYKVGSFNLRVRAKTLERTIDGNLMQMEGLVLRSNAKEVQISPETFALDSLRANNASGALGCRSFSYNGIRADNTFIAGTNLSKLLGLNKEYSFTAFSSILARINNLSYKDAPGYDVNLTLIPTSFTSGLVNLSFLDETADEQEQHLSLTKATPSTTTDPEAASPEGETSLSSEAKEGDQQEAALRLQEGGLAFFYDLENNSELRFSRVEAHLPMAHLEPIITAFGVTQDYVRMPESLNISGSANVNLDTGSLAEAAVNINIPKLVRTPNATPELKGQDVAIGLDASATLRTDPKDGVLSYQGDLHISHASGDLDVAFQGTDSGKVALTGDSTIDIKAINSLIDSWDAHSIIRDFDTKRSSRTNISNIDVKVDYSQGLQLDADCDVTLTNVGYQLGAYTDARDEEGNRLGQEKLRTDLGSDPFVRTDEVACHVRTKIHLDRKDAKGAPLPDQQSISIENPVLQYDNSGWIRRNKLTNGVRKTMLKGDRVLLDLEKNTVELFNLRGKVYPAYSIGMFYEDLFEFMSDARINYPVEVTTAYCRFPIAKRCTVPMTGAIACKSDARIDYNFIGITLPLHDFSGFIHITDDYITLDRLNAACWNGTLDAILKIGISGSKTTLDGYVHAGNMDLSQIAAAFNSEQNFALCNAEFRFQAKGTDVKDIQGYGRLEASSGDLMSLRIFHPIRDLVTDIPGYLGALEKEADGTRRSQPGRPIRNTTNNVLDSTGRLIEGIGDSATKVPFANHFVKYSLSDAHTDFDIVNGHLITRNAKALGVNLQVSLQMDIDLEEATMHCNLWPDISSIPTLVLAPITVLSNFMFDIVIEGPLDDLQWSIGLDKRLNGADKPGQDVHPKPQPARQSTKTM